MLYCLAACGSLFLTKSMPKVSASSSISSRLSRIVSHSMHSSSSEQGNWRQRQASITFEKDENTFSSGYDLYLSSDAMCLVLAYVISTCTQGWNLKDDENIQKKTAMRGDVSRSLSSMRKFTASISSSSSLLSSSVSHSRTESSDFRSPMDNVSSIVL